jgi:CRP-like cAMP-binding protein
MLVTIEKVMLLKVVELFSETPDEILVEVAERLHEMVFPAGTTIFEQGERGDSLYIIIDGRVEVLSGKTILDRLGPRQLFGEMALLDAEPRAASVRTVTETRLLRLDQEAFYELMDDRIEIAYGVIRVIVKRLRMNMLEVTRLNITPDTPPPNPSLSY